MEMKYISFSFDENLEIEAEYSKDWTTNSLGKKRKERIDKKDIRRKKNLKNLC